MGARSSSGRVYQVLGSLIGMDLLALTWAPAKNTILKKQILKVDSVCVLYISLFLPIYFYSIKEQMSL